MADPGLALTSLADRLQRLRVPVLVFICVLGVAVSIVVARRSHETQRQLLSLTFHRDVEDSLMLISQAMDLSLDQVQTLAAFIRSSDLVTPTDFRRFVAPALRRHATIQSMAWVPRVDAAARGEFERASSIDLQRPFEIRDASDSPPHRRAPERPVYYPITFVEPLQAMGGALGLDLAADPQRLATLDVAAAEGRLVTSMAIRPLGGGQDEPGFMALMPIYRGPDQPTNSDARRASLIGFAAAGFTISEAVERPLSYWQPPELQVYLFDTALPEGQQLLYARHAEVRSDITVEEVIAASPLNASRDVLVGGRSWLLVCTPTAAYAGTTNTNDPWIVLLVGLTLTGLVSLVLWGMIRSSDQLEAFARSRQAANDELRERIREREEAEEALAHANRELRQINADMERFVGAVSHDLKSPLIAAEMIISVMRQAVAKKDLAKIGEYSVQIAKACGRMRRIIDDLLEHQRAGFADLHSSAVDLTEVALHVVEEHRDEAMAKNVHVHLQDDMPTIRADRGRVTALLDNLVANALKYGIGPDEPAIHIGCETVADEVRIYVRDNGPGIPAEHRDRMWELFQRLSKDEEGTGIGLAIVKRVAEAHGGRAWMECPSAGGAAAGTTFWVAFPADRLVRSEPRRASSTASPTRAPDAPAAV